MKKWDLVEIVWEDAQAYNDPCNSDEYVRDYKPCLRKTVGYLIGVHPKRIFIATCDDRQALSEVYNEKHDVDGIWVIPRNGMIQSITVLTSKKILRKTP